MNPLQHAFQLAGLSEMQGMNLCQEHHLISDNCITSNDVAMADQWPAAEWIKQHPKEVHNFLNHMKTIEEKFGAIL